MIAALLVLALSGAPAEDPGEPPATLGLRAYEAGDYVEAARQFERAYAEDPLPDYLYAQGNALRMAGHCAAAIDPYRRFLATSPDARSEKLAQQNLAECEAVVAETSRAVPAPPPQSEPEPEPAPEPAPAVVADAPPPEPARTRRPIGRDPWAHALTWSGVAIGATGAGLLLEAHAREGRASRASDELGYRRAIEGAPTMSRVGIGLVSVGAGLVLSGVVRWVVLAARERSEGRRRHARARPRARAITRAWLGIETATGRSR